MAWCALARTWDSEQKKYSILTLRIEDTLETGCLIRLYEREEAVAEALAETAQLAMAKAVQLARSHLKDDSIEEDSLNWVQMP